MSQLVAKIAKNSFFNLVSMVTRFIIAILLSIATARYLGPNNFGSYTLVSFIFIVAGMVANLGLASVGTKYMAEFSGEQYHELRSSMLVHIMKIKIAALLLVTFSLLIFAGYLSRFYKDAQLQTYIIILTIGLLPSELAATLESIIRGFQEYKYLAYRSLIIYPIKIGLSFLVLFNGYGIIGLLCVNAVISIFEFMFYLIMIRKKLKLRFIGVATLPKTIKDKIFRYNWQVALIIFIDTIVWEKSEVFFLGYYHPGDQVAYYGLAYTIIERAMMFLPAIFSGVLMPVASELYGKKDYPRLQRLYLDSTRYLFLIAAPVCVILMTLSKPLINLLYGRSYLGTVAVLNILLISGCLKVVSSIGSSIQYGTESQTLILKWGSLLAVINIILDFLLIPINGAMGAAIANSTTQILGVVLGVVLVYKILQVKLPYKDLLKILAGALAMIPVIVFLMKLGSNVIVIIVSVITAISIYFIVIYLLGVIKETDLKVYRLIKQKFLSRGADSEK